MHAFVAAFVVFAAAHACGEHSFAPEKNTKKKAANLKPFFPCFFPTFFRWRCNFSDILF